jgi:hypothetical protein
MVDGTQVGNMVSPPSTSFTAFSITFTVASSGTHTITFAGTDATGDKTTFIDAVTLSSLSVTTTTTTLASSANPSLFGVSVTFTATVTGSAPTGNVAFSADGSTLSGCAAVALPAGSGNIKTATCSTSALSAGTHSIVASYGGDAGNSASTSAALTQVVSTVSSTSLVNPSFEIPALGSGYQFSPSAPGVGWTFGSGSGIQGNGSAWGAAPAPDGTQTAFIQNTGSISQALNLNAGSYTLSFQAAQRPYECCSAPYVQPIEVMVDGTQVGNMVSPPSTSFTAFSITFTVASSGTHTITFAGTDATGDKTTFIDAVTLQ